MNTERDDDTEAERAMKQLFAHAKPRPMPPPADADEIRRAVFAEWEAVTGRRMWVRRSAFAAAASVLLAAGLWFSGSLVEPAGPAITVARVERVQGSVGGIAVGGSLATGARVRTGEGQIAVRLVSGGSLRVGANSEVVLSGPDGAELVAGVIYFDSERQREGEQYTIETNLGSVRDVGTQFLVNVDPAQGVLDVGVREGLVVLTKDGESGTARAGERLVAEQGASGLRRAAIATTGGEWSWAERVAPPFDIDGRTVGEFLAWFSAQTGRAVVFASPDVERLASTARMSGSIDLEPLQKLSAVLAANEMTYRIDGDRVVIDVR